MRFAVASRLWLVLVPLALLVAYLVMQRRRGQYAVRFTNLDLLASVAPRRPGWRRHLPAAGLLLALLTLVVGFARPSRAERVPREEATVVLAIDVSASMAADDVSPSRLAAAQEAATTFVENLPERFRLGLIAYSGTPQVLVTPTTDRDAVVRAISNLELGPRTATGEAIFTALTTLENSVSAAEDDTDVGSSGEGDGSGDGSEESEAPPSAVVVMSDGKTTTGRPDFLAAEAAAEAGVPVSTIAYGTDNGVVVVEGQLVPVPVDRDALRAIADATDGSFFEAASGEELESAYRDVGSLIGHDTVRKDISAAFVGVGLVLALVAAALSLLWAPRRL